MPPTRSNSERVFENRQVRARSQGYALRPTNASTLSQVSTEELLLELRRRIIAPRDRRHNTWDDWDGGLDPRGDWPDEGSAASSTLPIPCPTLLRFAAPTPQWETL